MPSLARRSLAVVEFVVMTKASFNYHRPKCAPPSTYRMSPVTVAAAVRYMTASVMSLTVEGRPSVTGASRALVNKSFMSSPNVFLTALGSDDERSEGGRHVPND